MILPGISGSFLLLLLGHYDSVLNAIRNLDIQFLAIFGGGCITGLLSFSHILGYALTKHYNHTMSILTGFMLGSLGKIWPWRLTTHWRINSHGEQVPWIDISTLPDTSQITQVLTVFFLCLMGFIFVQTLERMTHHES